MRRLIAVLLSLMLFASVSASAAPGGMRSDIVLMMETGSERIIAIGEHPRHRARMIAVMYDVSLVTKTGRPWSTFGEMHGAYTPSPMQELVDSVVDAASFMLPETRGWMRLESQAEIEHCVQQVLDRAHAAGAREVRVFMRFWLESKTGNTWVGEVRVG